MPLTKHMFALSLPALLLTAGAADAQTMDTKAAAFSTGYGITAGEMTRAIDPSTRDANGNRVLVDGMIVTGTDNSVYAYSKTMGAGDSYSGAGALGGATAIGNNLSVVVNGNYNTVIVHSTQTNNGNVTATTATQSATGAQGTSTYGGGNTDTSSSLNGQLNGF